MKKTIFALMSLPILAACKDETISGYAPENVVWKVQSLNSKPFTAHATLSFPSAGKISGQAPCNHYSAAQKAPYPWFKIGDIAATKMACETLDQEAQFFALLSRMSISEVSGNVLVLSNESGETIVFDAI